MCKAGRGRALQCGGQVRGMVGEHGQPFVEVAVGRRDGDPVVADKLSQPGTVQEPAQDQHALFERPQGAVPLRVPRRSRCSSSSFARASAVARLTSSTPVYVRDTGQRVKPLGTRNLFFADLFLPGASRVSDAGSSPSDAPSQEDLGSVGRAAYPEPCPHYLGES